MVVLLSVLCGGGLDDVDDYTCIYLKDHTCPCISSTLHRLYLRMVADNRMYGTTLKQTTAMLDIHT